MIACSRETFAESRTNVFSFARPIEQLPSRMCCWSSRSNQASGSSARLITWLSYQLRQDQAKLVVAAPKNCRPSTPADARALNAIAGIFVEIFEGELGDARFVEVAETFGGHAVVLFLGGAGKR